MGIFFHFLGNDAWFLKTKLAEWLFVTYHQFGFEHVVSCPNNFDNKSDFVSQTDYLLSQIRRGYIAKSLSNMQAKHLVVKHLVDKETGSLHQESEPLAVVADERILTKQKNLVANYQQTFQTKNNTFFESFEIYLDALLKQPLNRISFHVFSIEHLITLHSLFRKKQIFTKCFVVTKHNGDQVYIQLDNTELDSSPVISYDPRNNVYTHQEFMDHMRLENIIFIVREDQEYFQHTKLPSNKGIQPTCCTKIIRWIVYDVYPNRWDLSAYQGRYIGVNTLHANIDKHWFLKMDTSVPIEYTFGFWYIVFGLGVWFLITLSMFGFFGVFLTYAIVLRFLHEHDYKQTFTSFFSAIAWSHIPIFTYSMMQWMLQ